MITHAVMMPPLIAVCRMNGGRCRCICFCMIRASHELLPERVLDITTPPNHHFPISCCFPSVLATVVSLPENEEPQGVSSEGYFVCSKVYGPSQALTWSHQSAFGTTSRSISSGFSTIRTARTVDQSTSFIIASSIIS